MQSSTLIPVEEYLTTSYRPDCEYLEGTILERNVGEYEHARLQTLLSGWLLGLEKQLRTRTVVEQRVQVKSSRFVYRMFVLSAPPIRSRLSSATHLFFASRSFRGRIA